MNKYARRGSLVLLVAAAALGSKCQNSQLENRKIGETAYALTQEMLTFGPRPPASASLAKVRDWIAEKLKNCQTYSLQLQKFDAVTPLGTLPMVNILVDLGQSQSDQEVILLAHYDSKKFDTFDFVGANDAASSVALLLAMAEPLSRQTWPFHLKLLFVDGEEALKEWSGTDSRYGSRHFVAVHPNRALMKAVVVLDMIGDSDLQLIRSAGNDPKLEKSLMDAVATLGKPDLIDHFVSHVEDDHTPFREAGVPYLHLMDFTYGGKSSPGTYWHTYQDTIEHISAASLETVSTILYHVLSDLRLEAKS